MEGRGWEIGKRFERRSGEEKVPTMQFKDEDRKQHRRVHLSRPGVNRLGEALWWRDHTERSSWTALCPGSDPEDTLTSA